MRAVAGGVVIAAVTVALLFVAFFGGVGVPATPTASISGTPNPAVAQTLQVTFISSVDAALVPSAGGIGSSNPTFTYSMWQTNANGGTTNLASNKTVPATPTSQPGLGVYNLTATVSVTTTAICTGATCAATPYNLTFALTTTVNGIFGVYTSPATRIIFSNAASYRVVPAVSTPSATTFNANFWGILSALVGLDVVLAGVFFARSGIVFGLGLVVLFVGWGGLVAVAVLSSAPI